ncbi:MAG: TldD/PmbA family protein [Deltaproteobacteria bacterium]|nr:TldD/PmbA family protein [Deltaproteobacteria bacterium]
MSGAIKLDETARKMMDGALQRGVKDVRVGATRSRNVSVTWRTGRVDKIQESSRLGVSLALYIDGRYTTCTTNDLRPEAIDRFLDSSVALCRAMTPDPYRVMPDPSLYAGREERELGLFDPAIADVRPQQRKDFAAAMEAAALAKAGDKAIQAETACEDEEGELFQLHSNGFEGTRRSSYFGAWATVSLQDAGDKRPEGDYDVASRKRAELPTAELVGTKAAEYGLLRMGTTKVPTAKMTMILENRAVGRLLGYLLAAASGRALQQKQSFLDGMIGKSFGSGEFDLLDDPFLAGGFGSRLFDGEGISAKPLPIFEKGVFRNFYVDVYYGKKLELPPTTGGRSNLVLAPGTKSLDELVAGVSQGILVRGFIGGNSNSTTGDFSTGIYGTRIENGALTQPIAEMNVAGNHKDFWQRLAEVGNDPWPYSSLRVPSLVFDGVQFSGE